MYIFRVGGGTNYLLFKSSVDDIIAKAYDALKRLEVFTSLRLLRVNVKKTFLLTFCRVDDSVDVSSKVLFGEKPILQVKSLRYLGSQIDSNLSWKFHSGIISAKIARGVGVLRRLKHILPERTLGTIYFSIIYPYISYECLVWSSNSFVNYKSVQILKK